MLDVAFEPPETRLRAALAGARVAHVLTVSASLRFLRGQISFMRQLGVDVDVFVATGPEVEAIAEA